MRLDSEFVTSPYRMQANLAFDIEGSLTSTPLGQHPCAAQRHNFQATRRPQS